MQQSYVAGPEKVYDADSHVMETPGWIETFASQDIRPHLELLDLAGAEALAAEGMRKTRERALGRETFDFDDLLKKKSWAAYGAISSQERGRALNLLGFSAQLVFPTLGSTQFRNSAPAIAHGGAQALNRAMCEFCRSNLRLLPVATIPWGAPEEVVQTANLALADGARVILVDPRLPAGSTAPTHKSFDPFWDLAAQTNTPVVTHVSDSRRSGVDPGFHRNGLGGRSFVNTDTGMRSKDFLVLHHPSQVFWSCVALDGVFERFPNLRGASIEEGCMWAVPWLKSLDQAMKFAFKEPALRSLRRLPSEYIRESFKLTPLIGDDLAWFTEQAGDGLLMFGSDYPHPEGSNDPMGRFLLSLGTQSKVTLSKFKSGNFLELFRGVVPF
jgi:uncharacterized protein